MIRGRLENDVGRLLEVASKNDIFAFWAFLRMVFPVVESIGDLVFREKSSTNNLKCILKEEFGKHNKAYFDVAALLIILYRHSLIHHDELGIIDFKNFKVSWALQFDWTPHNHLKITREGLDQVSICFNIKQFYDDTLKVCNDLYMRDDFNGEIGERYEKWKTIKLEEADGTSIKKEALREIKKLKSLPVFVPPKHI